MGRSKWDRLGRDPGVRVRLADLKVSIQRWKELGVAADSESPQHRLGELGEASVCLVRWRVAMIDGSVIGVGVYLLRLVGSEVLTEILELIGEYVVRDERALDVGAGGMYMCV